MDFLDENSWKNETVKNLRTTIRLVCLNKVYPYIPTLNDIRPIQVMAQSLRVLEMTVYGALDKYINNSKNTKNQFGFKRNYSTKSAKRAL